MRFIHTARLLEGVRLLVSNPLLFFKRALRFFRPMRSDYRKRFRMTLAEWIIYHQKNVALSQCHWMGVRALKNPFDAWIYQEIVYEVKPDIIIEIGSHQGGSTLFFANLLDIMGNGVVLSIDFDRSSYEIKHERIVEITRNSSSPETVAQATELCEHKTVLVVHDGDHRKENVLTDLRSYAGLVTVGSYFIVEDGILDLLKPQHDPSALEDGPLAATEQFLRENANFEVDRARERYILTYNPKGFLKRVR